MVRARRARLAAVLAIVLGTHEVSYAQHVGPDEARLEAVSALARRYEGVDVRWNLETGTPARIRFAPGMVLGGETPTDAARNLIDSEVSVLLERGVRTAPSEELVPATGPSLVLRGTRDLGDGRFGVELDQFSGRTPVLDSGVTIEVARTERGFEAVSVFAHYRPGAVAGGFAGEVEGALAGRFPDYREERFEQKTSWTRVVAPVPGGFRSAFAVLATVKGETFRILVDAQTGEELGRVEMSCSANVTGYCYEKDPGQTPIGPKPLTGLYVNQGANRVTTDAQGNHNLAGTVTIDQPGLSGPLMHVYVDGQREIMYSGAADAVLNFGDASYHTDEIAAWYHLNSYNGYFQQTYPGSTAAASVRIAVLVLSNFRNAYFSPARVTFEGESFPGMIRMGIFSGRSSARDATVIRHEYTHYLLNTLASLNGTSQAGGINEGLSDYFPCAQIESPLLGTYVSPPRMRTLENTLKWPADSMNGEVHRVGNIFNGALWQARKAAEAAKAGDRLLIDQAVFKGVLRFPRTPTLLDARDAIVAADQATYQGAHKAYLEQAFFDHGIGPRPATPPPPPPPGGTPPPSQTNQPPALGALTDQDVTVGNTLNLLVTATDPNADPVTLAVSSVPNASIQQTSTMPAQAMWTFRPTAAQVGVVRVTFTGTDGMLASSKTIAVRVLAAGTTPGSTAPTTSGTRPTGGTTAPGSTRGAGAAKATGGGGGGCQVGAVATGDQTLAWLPCGLALLVLVIGRRSRAAA